MDERIGTNSALPRLDVFGHPAQPQATQLHIGGGAIVLLPRFTDPAQIAQAVEHIKQAMKQEEASDGIASNTDSNF